MFPLAHMALSARSLKLLDTSGTALWNAFTSFVQRTGGSLGVDALVFQGEDDSI
jgi:hypothetical protein